MWHGCHVETMSLQFCWFSCFPSSCMVTQSPVRGETLNSPTHMQQMQRHRAPKQRCFSLLPTKLTFWKFELVFWQQWTQHTIFTDPPICRCGSGPTAASWDPEKMKRHQSESPGVSVWHWDRQQVTETDGVARPALVWLENNGASKRNVLVQALCRPATCLWI